MDSTNPLCIEEILLNIFDFLPLRDKKNATLVNKQWNEVCNRRKFTSKQAFFLPNMYDFVTITDFLSHCKRESLNLKFDQSRIDDDSLLLWSTCGDRIESLDFHNCMFRNGILPEMFKNCVNLIYLSLQRVQFFKDDKSDRVVEPRHTYWSKRYDAGPVASVLLADTNMVHEKLAMLSLDSRILRLRSSDLQRFSSAFPQLRIVKINMVLDDDLKPKESSAESPNLSLLFELLATKQKQIGYLNVQFTTRYSDDYVTFNFLMYKEEPDKCRLELDLGVASLEPFFKFSEALPPIPYSKYCTSIIVNARDQRYPFTDDHFDLEIRLARFIINNPQLQRVEVYLLGSAIPEMMAALLAALITSRLRFVHINVYAFYHKMYPRIEETLQTYNLTANTSVRRLKIRSNVDAFSAFCMKYFQNVEHLSVMPVGADADDVFKYQKNLKKLSIALVDKPFVPLSSVVSVESLEVLKIRGSILSFLSSYQFPNLKYLFFTFYTKMENPQIDIETQNEPIEERMDALLPLFGLELDKDEEQELQAQGSSTEAADESEAAREEQELQCQNSSPEASNEDNAAEPRLTSGMMAAMMILLQTHLDEDDEQESRPQNSSTEAPDESYVTHPQLGLDLDKGEEQESQPQNSSTEDADENNAPHPLSGPDLDESEEQELSQDSSSEASDEYSKAHWFIVKLHRIMPVLSTKFPNLEGLSFNDLSYHHLNATDYSLFFELCQNFSNLRYVSMRDKYGKIKEADIKAEMLKYMPKCPLLRAFWIETSNCRICRHFNVISRKFEFSDYYSNRSMNTYLNGVNLKKFYSYER